MKRDEDEDILFFYSYLLFVRRKYFPKSVLNASEVKDYMNSKNCSNIPSRRGTLSLS